LADWSFQSIPVTVNGKDGNGDWLPMGTYTGQVTAVPNDGSGETSCAVTLKIKDTLLTLTGGFNFYCIVDLNYTMAGTLVLTNTGNTTSIWTIGDSGDLSISYDKTGGTLAAGASVNIVATVSINPTSAGIYESIVTASDDYGNTSSVFITAEAVAQYTGPITVTFGMAGAPAHLPGWPQVKTANHDAGRKSWDCSASFSYGNLYWMLRYVTPGHAGYDGTERWRQKISEDEGAVTGDWQDYDPIFSAAGKPSGGGSLIFTCGHEGSPNTGSVAY
jgi:hypothetical protein